MMEKSMDNKEFEMKIEQQKKDFTSQITRKKNQIFFDQLVRINENLDVKRISSIHREGYYTVHKNDLFLRSQSQDNEAAERIVNTQERQALKYSIKRILNTVANRKVKVNIINSLNLRNQAQKQILIEDRELVQKKKKICVIMKGKRKETGNNQMKKQPLKIKKSQSDFQRLYERKSKNLFSQNFVT